MPELNAQQIEILNYFYDRAFSTHENKISYNQMEMDQYFNNPENHAELQRWEAIFREVLSKRYYPSGNEHRKQVLLAVASSIVDTFPKDDDGRKRQRI